MHRRRLLIAAAACAALAPLAHAATVADYTPGAFAAAQAAGRPILVHINASWCPTCAAQRPVLSQLEAEPKYKYLDVFRVDFDTQKDVVRAFGATMQATLIAFHGKTETGRAVGETRPDRIAALVASTLN